MVVHIQKKVLASFVMHISYACVILQGIETPTYEPTNNKHAKSPMAYSSHTGIQGTLAIWTHKRHHYTEKTSIHSRTMGYTLMLMARYIL